MITARFAGGTGITASFGSAVVQEATQGQVDGGTNTSRYVSPDKLENSKHNVDRKTVTIVSGTPDTLTLDFEDRKQRQFVMSAAASADFTLALSNDSNKEVWVLHAIITGTVNVTMPSGVVSDIGSDWDDGNGVLTLEGSTDSLFELSFTYDGTNIKLKSTGEQI